LLLTGGGRGNRAAAIARKLPDLNWQSSNIVNSFTLKFYLKKLKN